MDKLHFDHTDYSVRMLWFFSGNYRTMATRILLLFSCLAMLITGIALAAASVLICSDSVLSQGVGCLMMSDSKSAAERYRPLARECLETARTQNTEARATLLEMAQGWMRLAGNEEGSKKE